MIAASLEVAYIHEPFNIRFCGHGVCGARFAYWFTYITDENGVVYYEHLKNTLLFKYNLISQLKSIKNWKQIKRSIKEYTIFFKNRYISYASY